MSRMFTTSGLALCAAMLMGLPTLAQEIRGGALGLSHSAFLGDTSISKTSLDGQLEIGFGSRLSVQADLGFSHLNSIGRGTTNATLHGIYHVTDQTSLGLFYGADRLAGKTIDFTGFEVGQKAARFGVEAYVGYGEDAGISGTIGGVSGRYAISDSFGIGGAVEHGDMAGTNLTRLSLKSDYAVTPTIALTAEFGTLDSTGTGAEAFFGLGGTLRFGAGAPSFGKRGLINLVPGS